MARLQRLFRWSNVILIFLTLFAYLSPYIHPATLWPFAVLGLIYPILLALNLLFGIIWLLQRKYYALFSFGCILLGWAHFTAFIGLNFTENTPPIEDGQLRFLTYNIYGFLNRSETEDNKRWSEEQVREFYREHPADVWCFQEFPLIPKYADRYAKLISEKTPLKYAYHERGKGLAVFSRYPLNPVTMHYFNGNTNGYLIADLEKDGQKIRIFNIHLQSNAVSRMADDVANNGQIQEKKTWLKVKGMLGRYRRTAASRSDQALEIRERLDESPHPFVLCGDFNDVPLSYTYRALGKGLSDGFRKEGSGIATTFGGSLPALRIDYIFSRPELTFLKYQVLKIDRSDHYPVWSVFDMPKE